MRAAKLQKRAARHDAAPAAAGTEDLTALAKELADAPKGSEQAEQAAGKLLFAVTDLTRRADIDPEQALQKENEAFCRGSTIDI